MGAGLLVTVVDEVRLAVAVQVAAADADGTGHRAA